MKEATHRVAFLLMTAFVGLSCHGSRSFQSGCHGYGLSLHDRDAFHCHTVCRVDAHHVHARIELGHVQGVFVGVDFGVEDHLS